MDTEQSRQIWNTVAAAWERRSQELFATTRAASEWLVEQTTFPGATILETAAGTGDTSALAAQRVGPEGRVICTDFAPSMVDAARRTMKQRGIGNVECEVMDAQALDLADASVDGIVCRYGLMLMPDAPAAAREARRVLRAGGKFAYAVWAGFEHNMWFAIMGASIAQTGKQPPGDPFGPGGIASLSTEELNRSLLANAGFKDVTIEEIRFGFPFDRFEDFWEMQVDLAGPIAALLAALTEEELAQTKAFAEQMAGQFRSDDGSLEFPSLTLAVRAG